MRNASLPNNHRRDLNYDDNRDNGHKSSTGHCLSPPVRRRANAWPAFARDPLDFSLIDRCWARRLQPGCARPAASARKTLRLRQRLCVSRGEQEGRREGQYSGRASKGHVSSPFQRSIFAASTSKFRFAPANPNRRTFSPFALLTPVRQRSGGTPCEALRRQKETARPSSDFGWD
jgi:hypothetical protein